MRETPYWVQEHLKKTIITQSTICLHYMCDRPADGFCTYQTSDFTDKTPAYPATATT